MGSVLAFHVSISIQYKITLRDSKLLDTNLHPPPLPPNACFTSIALYISGNFITVFLDPLHAACIRLIILTFLNSFRRTGIRIFIVSNLSPPQTNLKFCESVIPCMVLITQCTLTLPFYSSRDWYGIWIEKSGEYMDIEAMALDRQCGIVGSW